MAAELLLVAGRRRGASRPATPDDRGGQGWCEDAEQARLYQFFRSDSETRQYSRPVPAHERPPARLVKP
jgi:hypothetical protein